MGKRTCISPSPLSVNLRSASTSPVDLICVFGDRFGRDDWPPWAQRILKSVFRPQVLDIKPEGAPGVTLLPNCIIADSGGLSRGPMDCDGEPAPAK